MWFTGTPRDATTRSETPTRMTPLRVLLGLTEELAGTQSKRARDPLEVGQGEILLAPLDSADVRAVHMRTIREDFLRESRGTSKSLNYVAKSDLQWPHARNCVRTEVTTPHSLNSHCLNSHSMSSHSMSSNSPLRLSPSRLLGAPIAEHSD